MCAAPHPCPELGGKDSVCRVSGVLPSLVQHTPILSSLNLWCEQLDSVWTWGKGDFPGKVQQLKMETFPPRTGGLGTLDLILLPSAPPFLCF